MRHALGDLQYALRLLRRNPGFAAVAILTLALGIGANTAIFSVVNATLLQSLPYAEPEQLIYMHQHPGGQPDVFVDVSYPNYLDWRESARSFEDLAAIPTSFGWLNVELDDEVVRVGGSLVSANLFDVLGVQPILGRGIAGEEDRPGAERVAVLGFGLWQRLFGASRDAIGQTLTVSGTPHTIIGVMPVGFEFPPRAELWTALVPAVEGFIDNRNVGFLSTVGRLAPGVTLAQARGEMDAIMDRVTRPLLPPGVERGITMMPLETHLLGDLRRPLLILLGAAGLVLLIACANVANLFVVRGTAREREFAVRSALGAGRGRLARQLVVESAVITFLGGIVGLILAGWGVDRLIALRGNDVFRASQMGIDGAVLGFTLVISTITALVFGLAPAIQHRAHQLTESLKQGGARSSGGLKGRRTLNVLVVSEVALAVMLIIGAGLLIRSFAGLWAADTGFQRDEVLTAGLYVRQGALEGEDEWKPFFGQLVRRLEATPGVEAAAGVLIRPLEGPQGFDAPFTVEGQSPEEQSGNPLLNYQIVTEHYFTAMGLRLIRGREFNEADREDVPGVVIVGQTVADRYWPGGDPVGRRLKWGAPESSSPWLTVVGVVPDGRYRGMRSASLDVYLPYQQSQFRPRYLVLRTAAADPRSLAPNFRETVQGFDSRVKVADIATINELVSRALTTPRFNTALLGLFAALALTLGAIGIYGVLAYTVSQRTQEIGIRVALGAAPVDVVRMVVAEGMVVAALGVTLGLGGAFGLTRVMENLLYDVGALDPTTFVAVSLLVMTVAFFASYLPAARATRVDPMIALRAE